MRLAVDIGNTESVFGIYRNGTRQAVWRFPSNDSATEDDLAVKIHSLAAMKQVAFDQIDDVVVASVRESVMMSIAGFCKKFLNKAARQVGRDELSGFIKTNVNTGARVGSDRLVNAWWAHKNYQTSAVVVDFGTATNFDIVDDKGVFQGGIISTGLNLSAQALYARAANLVQIPLSDNPKVLGKDTVSAMQSGLFWGHVGMIEGILKRLKESKDISENATIIATGGLATLFKNQTNLFDLVQPFFTLDGINALGDKFPPRKAKN